MCEQRKKWRGRGQRGEKGERDEVEKFWLMMRIQRGERKRESGDEEKIISSTNGSEEGKPRLCVMTLKPQSLSVCCQALRRRRPAKPVTWTRAVIHLQPSSR